MVHVPALLGNAIEEIDNAGLLRTVVNCQTALLFQQPTIFVHAACP
jgi:hypothetical protein